MIDRVFIKKYEPEEENLRLVQGYINKMSREGKSEKTLSSYDLDMRKFLEFLKVRNLSIFDVHEEEVEEFFFECQKDGIGKGSIERRFSCVKRFYKHLIDGGWIQENPMKLLKRDNQSNYVIDETYLTTEQVSLIRKHVTKNLSTQLCLYFELSISSGIKSYCLPSIKLSQIDLENQRINNVIENPTKVVTVYFSKRVKEIILKLIDERKMNGRSSEYLFINPQINPHNPSDIRPISMYQLRKMCGSLGRVVKFKDLTPSTLRFTCGHLLIKHGLSEEEASIILNHRTDAGTVLYEQRNIDSILEKKNIANI